MLPAAINLLLAQEYNTQLCTRLRIALSQDNDRDIPVCPGRLRTINRLAEELFKEIKLAKDEYEDAIA